MPYDHSKSFEENGAYSLLLEVGENPRSHIEAPVLTAVIKKHGLTTVRSALYEVQKIGYTAGDIWDRVFIPLYKKLGYEDDPGAEFARQIPEEKPRDTPGTRHYTPPPAGKLLF